MDASLARVLSSVCRILRQHPTLVNDEARLTVLVADDLGFSSEEDGEGGDDGGTTDEDLEFSSVLDLLRFAQKSVKEGATVVGSDNPFRRCIGYHVTREGQTTQWGYVTVSVAKTTLSDPKLKTLGLDPTEVRANFISPGGRIKILEDLREKVKS